MIQASSYSFKAAIIYLVIPLFLSAEIKIDLIFFYLHLTCPLARTQHWIMTRCWFKFWPPLTYLIYLGGKRKAIWMPRRLAAPIIDQHFD